MKKKYREQPRKWLTALTASLILAFGCCSVWAARPVAVVDGGQLDMLRFTKRVMASSGYAWEECGKFLDTARFKDYSIVVWFGGHAEPLSETQIEEIVAYLESGGRILHTAGGLYATGLGRNLKPHPWTGAERWNYVSKKPNPHYPVLIPNHPYLAGIDTAKSNVWQNAHYHLTIDPEKTQNIIGEDNKSILAATSVGQGEIVWFWEGLFRANHHERPEDSKDYDRVLLNIIEAAKPLHTRDLIKSEVPALAKNPAALVCWKSDWDYSSQDDYVFRQPYPLPEEIVHRIDFHSAIGERDTQFILCQSLEKQVFDAELKPLVDSKGRSFPDRIKLFVSDKPPLVPSHVRAGHEELPRKLGRFMLVAVTNSLSIDSWRPRVLWLRVDTEGLEAGTYSSSLGIKGGTKFEIPVSVKVYPVRMPRKPIAELVYWGASFPNREPFFRESKRQNISQISLRYPTLENIVIRSTGETLRQIMRKKSDAFAGDKFPELDFRKEYEDEIMGALDNGLTYIRVHDVRTGRFVAETVVGKILENAAPDKWPLEAQRLYTGYYHALYEYLREKGFEDVDMSFIDEPSWQAIQEVYIPRARLHMAGGMGSGTHWTAGGFLTPEQINAFAPYTTDWSMYTIMMPNFLKFLKEGSIKLHPRSKVGLTRGGTGLSLRNPFNRLRTYAWELVYYGEPVNFLRTGPVWKEWLYYVDFGRSARKRPDGVEGERLVAYGGSDRFDGDTDLLSSSDWESGREGIDDVNLVRMLEWYLAKIEDNALLSFRSRRVVEAIRTDMDGWFIDTGAEDQAAAGFDADGKLEDDGEDIGTTTRRGAGFAGFQIQHRTHGKEEKQYRYQSLVPPSSAELEGLKHRVLEHLMALKPYIKNVGGDLSWHGWELVDGGKPKSWLVIPAQSTMELRQAVADFQDKCIELSGGSPTVSSKAKWKPRKGWVNIYIGTASDPEIASILKAKGWRADADYPGENSYVIKRDRDDNLLAIIGADEPGLLKGLKNFSIFLDGRGNWLF